MKRTTSYAALALTAAIGTTLAGTAAGQATPASPAKAAHHAQRASGKWTKISTGNVGTTSPASVVRGSDGDLHVVYTRGNGPATIGHVAVHTNGTIARQNTVLASLWTTMDLSPAVVSGAGDLRVVWGGVQSSESWGIRTATSDNTGSSWALSAQPIGSSTADGSYGTAAATLSDGTPIVAFPLNHDLFWHVGTSTTTDQSYTDSHADLFAASVVSDGSHAWAAWYQLGDTAASTGIFVKQIYPTAGPTMKAPDSSKKKSMVQPDSRVALAARKGGGVYAAYCVGYPTCDAVQVWKVGTHQTAKVPHSKFVTSVALSPSPAGRLWIAWSDNLPKVRAVRTGPDGLRMGAVQTAGLPPGRAAAHSLAIDGTAGRGDIVLNAGTGIWYTQVFAGLTLQAAPSKWRHHTKQKVTFSVTDAHTAVAGAKVTVGSAHCTTNSHGTCSITFPKSYGQGKHTAKATKSGYGPATAGLKVS